MPEDEPTTDPVSRDGTSTVQANGAQLRPGERIGHYKILEEIGEGGCPHGVTGLAGSGRRGGGS